MKVSPSASQESPPETDAALVLVLVLVVGGAPFDGAALVEVATLVRDVVTTTAVPEETGLDEAADDAEADGALEDGVLDVAELVGNADTVPLPVDSPPHAPSTTPPAARARNLRTTAARRTDALRSSGRSPAVTGLCVTLSEERREPAVRMRHSAR
ncbi:hypothetical protein GIS00_19130 [Nakamurella sp. YIM 132087]|uniref:Uncharacterized protein n=1 Tax=Nakamurella alba TaxID=2665158 RepID=A0A7K1FTC7_9ACTN|nr:hypothetical protein [Nakamurella alba]MTD16054.1 hypothetical protein [Nakamurella alba]